MMLPTYLANIVLISILIASSTSLDSETGILDDESVQLAISKFESVEQVYFPHLHQVINNLNSIIKDEKLSRQCKHSLIRLTNGIIRKEHWALSFYDSSSQGKSGKLSGSHQTRHHRFDSSNAIDFKGHFCMLSIRTNEYDVLVNQNPELYNKTMSDLTKRNRQWYEFNLGNIAAVCIPSTCEIDRLLDIINQKLANSNISIVSQKQCSELSDVEDRNFSLMESIAICVLSSCVLSVLVGTCWPVGWLRHFDLVENNRKLFKKVTDPERSRYKSLHGFKFLYLLLSIMAHVWFIFIPLIPLLFGGNRNYDIGNILFREISAGSLYLPDVMFLIGGLLTCVMWYPLFEKTKGKISFFNFALLRWFRTTPVIVSVLLIGFIYPRYGSGPFFNDLANHMQTNCRNNFWKNLLYIANFDRGLNMCLPQTWYICCDFQLYLLHYLTIFYLYKRPSVGLLIAFGQIALSCLYIFWSTYFNELPSYLRVNEITLLSIINTEYHYLDTFVHSNVYTLGVLCECVHLFCEHYGHSHSALSSAVCPVRLAYDYEAKHSASQDNLISLVSFSISLSIFFIPRYIDSMSSDLAMSLWASVVRIIFVFYFVCAFYSYSFGGAKYLRFIMTYDFQVPFSRMCLSIVVAQFIYILYYFGTRREMINFNTFDQTKEGIAAFILCCSAGYLLYLLVEAPFSNLLMDFASRGKTKVSTPVRKQSQSQADDHPIWNDSAMNGDQKLSKNSFKNSNLVSIVRKISVDEKKIN